MNDSEQAQLKHFVRDGVWASICEGFAESNFAAFSNALSATSSDFAILASSESLTGCWLQLWSERLTRVTGSRKKLVTLCVTLQAVILSLMMAYSFLSQKIWPFMALSLVFCLIGSFSGSIWAAWMGDLLPSRRRGYCFGVRNKLTYSAQFLALLAGGLALQLIQGSSKNYKGTQIAFCLVFLVGFIAKLFSLKHLLSQDEKHQTTDHSSSMSPTQLLQKGYHDPVLKRVVLFFGIFGFSVNISGPFQTPYLLKTLGFGYLAFASTTAAPIIARFLSARWIGKIIDQQGYRKTFIVSTLLMPLVTLGWCLSTLLPIILLSQFLSGIIWTGFELSSFCLLTENSTSNTRQQIQSLKQISWNLFSSVGALTGGYLLHAFSNPCLLFWSSTLARVAAGLLALFLFTRLQSRFFLQ